MEEKILKILPGTIVPKAEGKSNTYAGSSYAARTLTASTSIFVAMT